MNSIFTLRALAEKSSRQPRENRRYDAARKAAVEAICSEVFTGYDRVADEAAGDGDQANGGYRNKADNDLKTTPAL